MTTLEERSPASYPVEPTSWTDQAERTPRVSRSERV